MKARRYWLDRIQALDPVADHEEIYRISAGHEFPWDYTRALELALFRTYCVPSISALLSATGEFRERPQKRYDDTALLMAELASSGYDSERGKEALRVINRAHGRYPIAADDMRYVLSTFIYEPIDWLDRFGWRPLSGHERLAAFHFYCEVGRRMGIRDIPAGFDEFRAFKVAYEAKHFSYADTNREIGKYTLELLCSWYPRPLRPAARLGVRALLDDAMRTAFGFDAAPAWVTRVAQGALRLRARVVARMPARMTSRLARDPGNRTYPGYPQGYRPSDLGVDNSAGRA
ncbi:peptidase [Rhizocola hellebori]|uniref:Peptidase n=1 Tax=Rhizocola hellebori TaxID=1392758 RepID=A0A8J3Q4T8_9ACTN|nr:oxygenase MpaB family protein [Rhizocola hellebori]GIH03825.1 peptidase [Rhizocola hellebori]